MRICIVTSSFQRYPGDYAGQHVHAQATGLSRRHQVYVIYPTNVPNADTGDEPFHRLPFVYPFKTYPMAQVRGFDLLNLFKLLSRMQQEMIMAKRLYNIDLFYAFWALPSAVVCSFSCGKTPYIVNVPGSDDKVFGRGGIARPMVKYALSRASRVIPLSYDLKNDAIAMGVAEKNIIVVPSGINISEYTPREKALARSELGLPDKFMIIYVGSLFKLKRIEWLIKISAELGKTHDFLSLIIGSGPENEYLNELAVQLGANNVRFLGQVNYKKVPLYISASNVLVLFSETEGLPSVVQEALASGVPVVATNVGGVVDIVHQGMTGYVIRNEDEAKECLKYLMESPSIVDHMGLISRKYSLKNLSHEHVFEQINAICESVIEEHGNLNAFGASPVVMDRQKSGVGIVSTFPPMFISRVVDAYSPLSHSIHVVAPELSRNDVVLHTIKYDLSGNIFKQAANQILAQVNMSIEVFRLRNKVKFWNFIGGEVFLLPVVTAKLLGMPTVLSIQGNLDTETALKKHPFNRLQLVLKRVNYSLADRLTVFSPRLIEKWKLQKYLSKILIMQTQYVDGRQFYAKVPLQNRKKIIGYVGRLSPEKGVLNLLESIPLVLRDDPDVKLKLIGDGPLNTEVKSLLDVDGLKESVLLAGSVPLEQIPDFMNEFRLLVIPSFSEGLPSVLLEAMACGTPVLSTPAGAIDEVISDGVTGFLLENNAPETIAREIIKAINNPECATIASAAKGLIEKKYSLSILQKEHDKTLLADF